MKPLLTNRSKIVLAPASSAYKHSLKEVLASTAVAGQIKVRDGQQAAVPISVSYLTVT